MNWGLVGIVMLVAIAFLIKTRLQQPGGALESAGYRKQAALFSPAERSFLGALTQAVGEDARILAKVRVADVVTPQKGLSRSDRQRAFNRIAGKHFDYVLCRNDDLAVVCAIELHDGSHRRADRQQRDGFLERVCRAADLPLLQVPAKGGYVVGDLRRLVAPYLNGHAVPAEKTEGVVGAHVCPRCSAPMVIRVAQKGSQAGKRFWACSAFPNCRYVAKLTALPPAAAPAAPPAMTMERAGAEDRV